MKYADEKGPESIIFGIAIALLILIVSSAVLFGGGKEAGFYPTSQGPGIAGSPVRNPANLPSTFK